MIYYKGNMISCFINYHKWGEGYENVFFTTLLLGGLIMIGLAGCGENKNSREWIENKVSEVSRVYPTRICLICLSNFRKGLILLKHFIWFAQNSSFLDGDEESQTIKGKIETIQISTDPYKEEVEEHVDVEYKDGEFIFSNNEVAEKIWGYKGFLFQKIKFE